MPLTTRHYIFEADGALKRVPRRIVDALPFGTDAIPEYADTRQRHAEVLIENEDRKPVRVLDVIGTFWDFDDQGKIDASLRRSGAEWLNYAFSPMARNKTDGPVVDLVPELKRKELHAKHRWTITKDELDLIAADLWPGINGPAPEIASVKGKAHKKPPLTYDARAKLTEISIKVSGIAFEIGELGEPDLKGLEFEALRNCDFEQAPLWRGVAEEAKSQRAILAAHRTGRGEWVAVIEALRSVGPHEMHVVATAHEKCATRDAAVEAGKRLMAEKAAWLGADIELSVKIWSALEWRPDDWK